MAAISKKASPENLQIIENSEIRKFAKLAFLGRTNSPKKLIQAEMFGATLVRKIAAYENIRGEYKTHVNEIVELLLKNPEIVERGWRIRGRMVFGLDDRSEGLIGELERKSWKLSKAVESVQNQIKQALGIKEAKINPSE